MLFGVASGAKFWAIFTDSTEMSQTRNVPSLEEMVKTFSSVVTSPLTLES
jgi:hypothetical protein